MPVVSLTNILFVNREMYMDIMKQIYDDWPPNNYHTSTSIHQYFHVHCFIEPQKKKKINKNCFINFYLLIAL